MIPCFQSNQLQHDFIHSIWRSKANKNDRHTKLFTFMNCEKFNNTNDGASTHHKDARNLTLKMK